MKSMKGANKRINGLFYYTLVSFGFVPSEFKMVLYGWNIADTA